MFLLWPGNDVGSTVGKYILKNLYNQIIILSESIIKWSMSHAKLPCYNCPDGMQRAYISELKRDLDLNPDLTFLALRVLKHNI